MFDRQMGHKTQCPQTLTTQCTVEHQLFTVLITYLTGGCRSLLLSSVTGQSGPHTSSLGEGRNSNFQVWLLLHVYHFCTIVRSKNHKSNYPILQNIGHIGY